MKIKKAAKTWGKSRIIGIVLIGIVLMFSLAAIISAITSDEQTELDNLITELENEGYNWLVEYTEILEVENV